MSLWSIFTGSSGGSAGPPVSLSMGFSHRYESWELPVFEVFPNDGEKSGRITHLNSSPLDLWMVMTLTASAPSGELMERREPLVFHQSTNEATSAG